VNEWLIILVLAGVSVFVFEYWDRWKKWFLLAAAMLFAVPILGIAVLYATQGNYIPGLTIFGGFFVIGTGIYYLMQPYVPAGGSPGTARPEVRPQNLPSAPRKAPVKSQPLPLVPVLSVALDRYLPRKFPALDKPLPNFGEGFLKSLAIFERERLLNDHLAYLAERKTAFAREFEWCVANYRDARQHLGLQRRVLLSSLDHAQIITAGLTSTAGAALGTPPLPITIPAAPLYETPTQLATAIDERTRAAGRAGAAGYSQGGALGAAAGLIAGVALLTIKLQKSVRLLEASHGELRLYRERAIATLHILHASLRELKATSASLHDRDRDIRSLISATEVPGVLDRFRANTATEAENSAVSALIAHCHIANAYVGMGD